MSELKLYTPIPATSIFPEVQSEPKLRCTVEWNTLIREAQRKGKENRTAKLSEPRFSIDGADFIMSDDDYDNFAQAFINKDGKVTGFPFKFPLDYYTTATAEYYDPNTYQQGVLTQLTTTTFQACKKYCVSSISSYKTLNNLVNGTVSVYKDNVLQTSGITVNLTTGVFTFSSAPSGVLTLSCEHRPNFRFDVDDLQLTQIKKAVVSGDRNVFKSVNFKLVEDNYAKLSPLNSGDWNSDIVYDLAVYATNTTYSDRFLSFVESGDNKREIREGFDVTRKLIKLESSNANWKRTQLYYTLFNVAKGRLLSFDFDTTQVRFDQDTFTSEQLGVNAWTFDGLSMIQTLFSSSVEVKNYAHFIKIGLNILDVSYGQIFAETLSTFTDTVNAPSESLGKNPSAYLINGGFDDVLVIGNFDSRVVTGSNLGGTYSGYFYLGTAESFTATIINTVLPYCSYFVTIRWTWS